VNGFDQIGMRSSDAPEDKKGGPNTGVVKQAEQDREATFQSGFVRAPGVDGEFKSLVPLFQVDGEGMDGL